MNDSYLSFVNGGPGKAVAKQLGLPRPAVLRRTADLTDVDSPLVPGRVVVLTDGSDAARVDADALVEHLLAWGADVRRDAGPGGARKLGAVVLVATGLERSADLTEPALAVGGTLRELAPSARVLVLSRAAGPEDSPGLAAARAGVDGFVRSLAKELRAGATGNGIALAGGASAGDPSPAGAARFLLSARSAFVDGQILTAGPGGQAPADWARPLTGLVVAVTGAARGIGAEIARVAARDGAHVVGVDVPAAGEALAATVNAAGGIALQLDVTRDDAAERILAAAHARYGRLDVVVHNAGILRDKLLANMTEDRFADLLAVNIAAPVLMNETFAEPGALGDAAHAPRIISLASTSGIAGNRGQTNYGYAKSGIIGMTRALAPLMAASGGTANAVAPGFIETDMTAKIPAVPRQASRRMSSLQQGGLPVDVAEAIAFLASPQAGGINGEVLRVCGQLLVGR
ncbi:3-oxoacyl-ACP reductase [Georgenia sp. Z1491]|uniref:3-oxoacyl-ACP reductase n=1 Tax=Georgenia sp. Z1491 TaxID=3416707 RepID=UPI003CF936FB